MSKKEQTNEEGLVQKPKLSIRAKLDLLIATSTSYTDLVSKIHKDPACWNELRRLLQL